MKKYILYILLLFKWDFFRWVCYSGVSIFPSMPVGLCICIVTNESSVFSGIQINHIEQKNLTNKILNINRLIFSKQRGKIELLSVHSHEIELLFTFTFQVVLSLYTCSAVIVWRAS